MTALICFVLAVLVSPIMANIRLEAENAVLRHQLIVLRRGLEKWRRQAPPRYAAFPIFAVTNLQG